MLLQRPYVERIAERIGPDSFHDQLLRSVFEALLEVGETASLEELSAKLDPEAVRLVEEYSQDEKSIIDAARTVDDSITRLHVREIEDRLSVLDRLLPLASAKERDDLADERNKLILQKRGLRKGSYKAVGMGRPR
jgi:hypothetical protein